MTFTLAIFALTFLAASWLAVDLLRPSGAARRHSGSLASPQTHSSYAPLCRLLEQGDFEYVSGQSDLADKLSDARRAATRLYLRQIRRDYLEIWGVCRLLAPICADPNFASRLSSQYWAFHWTYLNVQIHCLAPSIVRQPASAGRLVLALTEVRDQARVLLAGSDSALSMPASA